MKTNYVNTGKGTKYNKNKSQKIIVYCIFSEKLYLWKEKNKLDEENTFTLHLKKEKNKIVEDNIIIFYPNILFT